MRKFNDLLKFTWKRFSVWILLVTIFCTMAVGILVQNNIKNDYERFTNNVLDMRENLYGGKHNEDIEINEESIDKIKIEALKLK